MIKITDTHSHYNDKAFDSDRYELLARLLDESCESIMIIGWDTESSKRAVDIACRSDRVYAAVGIHPENCAGLPDSALYEIEALAASEKVKAIGETGFDFHYDGYDRAEQEKWFSAQLALAEKLSLPAVIHSRDAMEPTLRILRTHRPRAVMHCYSGSAQSAAEIISLGLMISFTGVLTFRNARRAAEACKAVPDDRLMLETDCPYMSPEPHRGERCDSGMLIYTAAKAAEIRGTDTESLIKRCNENAARFFDLRH